MAQNMEDNASSVVIWYHGGRLVNSMRLSRVLRAGQDAEPAEDREDDGHLSPVEEEINEDGQTRYPPSNHWSQMEIDDEVFEEMRGYGIAVHELSDVTKQVPKLRAIDPGLAQALMVLHDPAATQLACSESLRMLRDAARADVISCLDCSLAVKIPDVGAPTKPKKDDVARLATQMTTRNSEGYRHTLKGAGLPYGQSAIRRAPGPNYRVGKVDTACLHELTFGTLGRGLLHRAVEAAMASRQWR